MTLVLSDACQWWLGTLGSLGRLLSDLRWRGTVLISVL